MIELFDKYVSWKILKHFALNPTREFYVKGIAKELNLSAGICSKTLRELLELGLLEKHLTGQAHYYRLSNNYVTKALKRFLGISVIYDSDIVNKIIEKFENPTTIALYGSFANGDFIEDSDVDILVLSQKRKQPELQESVLNHKVNIVSVTVGEWLKLRKERDPFYVSVRNSYVLLYGVELPWI